MTQRSGLADFAAPALAACRPCRAHRAQQGATLIIGLIMLAVITLMVVSAFNLSTTNLKSTVNMQRRAEALAAGNKAIEQIISSPFMNAPSVDQINVDINQDGVNDYVVNIAAPACISATRVIRPAASGTGSSISLNLPAGTVTYNTIWDIEASVADLAGSGGTVTVRQGVRVVLSEAQFQTVCS